MLNKFPEKQMHLVRWLLAIGWLVVIFSLFYDPITPLLTDPNNLGSPFRLKPDLISDANCVKLQGECLEQPVYAMGARVFWAMIVPTGIFVLMILGHEVWRRVCPLSFLSQIPRALGIQRKRKVVNPTTGSVRQELASVDPDSWLGRNYLYMQLALFFIGLCVRILFVNSDRLSLGIFLVLTILTAITVGYLFNGKSWCQYFCPMAPVQYIYTGPRSLLGSVAHTTEERSAVTQSMCRTVNPETKQEQSACVSCKSSVRCFDIDAEAMYWQWIERPDVKLLYYTYFGLMLGFYFYYLVYAGSWHYYFSGVWTHESPSQWATLFKPGFYLYGQVIPIPKLVAVPLTLGFFGLASYITFSAIEQICRAYLRSAKRFVSSEQVQHIVYSIATFASFNVFFIFGGRPNIRLFNVEIQIGFNIVLLALSTIWLYRTLGRSKDQYTREGLASSLRRQLSKLSIDFAKHLGGRSVQDLNADEIYVLAKVLPGANQSDKLKVYKGVLQETLGQSNLQSSKALEVLQNLRQQLGVSEPEHLAVLAELRVEDPSLLDPGVQKSRESLLRLESYRQALEILVQKVVEGGLSLRDALTLEQRHIRRLRQEYNISDDEQNQVLSSLFKQDSELVRQATQLTEQLRILAYQSESLRPWATPGAGTVFSLLRASLQQAQRPLINQLLAALEILGDQPEARKLASSAGLFASQVLRELLTQRSGEAGWRGRLSPALLNLLEAPGEETQAATVAFNPDWPAQPTSHEKQKQVLQQVLTDLLKVPQPLLQAASLYALRQTNFSEAKSQAGRVLQESGAEALVVETAQRIVSSSQTQTLVQLTLMINQGDQVVPRTFQQPMIRIGRAQDNELVLPEKDVSRYHACLWVDEQRVIIEDLGSANGLLVGSKTLKHKRQILQPGDVIGFARGSQTTITLAWEAKPQNLAKGEGTLLKTLWLFEHPLFSSLDTKILLNLAQQAQVRSYPRGVQICRSGQPVSELLLLVQGQAQSTDRPDRRREAGPVFCAGQLIDPKPLLNGHQHSLTVISEQNNTQALAIDASLFEEILNKNSQFMKDFLVTLNLQVERLGA